MNTSTTHLSFSDTNAFSDVLLSYLAGDEIWNKFITSKAKIESIPEIIKAKQANYPYRKQLVETIKKQYASIEHTEQINVQINKLENENTFTITTAHQPVVLGGPMYVALKVLHAIKLAAYLNETYPTYNFVPVYVMGSEDHDFDEISEVKMFGKSVKWKREATGPVGRLSLEGFEDLFHTFNELTDGTPNAEEVSKVFQRFINDSTSFADFHFRWMNYFFGEMGLLILKPDDEVLKQSMVEIWKDELEHSFVAKTFEKTASEWPETFKFQATPRDINLFYIHNGQRLRLTKEDSVNGIKTADGELDLTVEDWIKRLQQSPQDFSPNVFLRPVYQCTILPDIVFIGGPSEIAYWLELKKIFENSQTTLPVLLPRASALWIDKNKSKKRQKLGLSVAELFKDTDQVIKEKLLTYDEALLSLDNETKQVNLAFNSILEKATKIDKTLEKSVKGELTKTENSIENLLAKMIRARKRQNENFVNQVYNLNEKLFPNGALQERSEAFLVFYLLYGKSFFDTIYDAIDPFTATFKVIEEIAD